MSTIKIKSGHSPKPSGLVSEFKKQIGEAATNLLNSPKNPIITMSYFSRVWIQALLSTAVSKKEVL